MREPRRLLESQETPALLREALRAVAPHSPSAEALERMRANLPRGRPAAKSGSWPVLGGAHHAVLLASAVAAALGLQGERPILPSPPPTAAHVHGTGSILQPSAAALAAAPPDPAHSAHATTGLAAEASERRPLTGEGSARPLRGAPARATHSGLAHDRSWKRRSELEPSALTAPGGAHAASEERADDPGSAHAAPAQGSEKEPLPVAASEPAGAAPPDAPSATSRERHAEAHASRAGDSGASAPPDLSDPQDEAGLVYRAKRLAVRDPQAALQLLAAHLQHFPAGELVEEREVLTIRLHRRLGHAGIARWLSAQFRAQHPRSVYLPSLYP